MNKEKRYVHLYKQLEELLMVTDNPVSRMSTAVALLHHKMEGFSWTGFYLLIKDELLVGTYQGPVACQKLKKDTGVCWAGIRQKKSIVVEDVHKFPGHIACDSRSNSEIVVPVFGRDDSVIGVLDIDSRNFNQFDEVDALHLEKIVSLIFSKK